VQDCSLLTAFEKDIQTTNECMPIKKPGWLSICCDHSTRTYSVFCQQQVDFEWGTDAHVYVWL